MGTGFGDGSQLSQKRAKQALPLLVARAKAARDITYQELARQMGIHHRTLAYPLGTIGEELENLGKSWKTKIPAINCLVVSKAKGTPGRGIDFAMPYQKFMSLTPLAQKAVMQNLYAGIWSYPEWDRVLKHYGIAPVIPADSLEPIAAKARYAHHGEGGESEEHQALKAYLFSNPQVVDIPHGSKGTQEYAFISADRIDLLFKAKSKWFGVEVKGGNVDEAELLRGIFQAVKYQALIAAQQRYEHKTVDGQVVLAIGRNLPDELVSLADLLEVTVVQNISVPAAFMKKAKVAKVGACKRFCVNDLH